MRITLQGKLALTAIFVFLQALLSSVTTITIFMELYFFSWLVRVGEIPYRDFFDHHGFLIYLLLAPLAPAGDISLLKWLTIVISIVNLLLFLFLLRKENLRVFALGALLFILFSYVMVQNTLSYDLFLMPFFLGIATLLQSPVKKHTILIGSAVGLLVASITLIKFLPGILVLGVVLYFRKVAFSALCVFLGVWALALGYLIYFGAFDHFIDGYFRFNAFLLRRMPLIKFDGILDPQLPILLVIGIALAVLIYLVVQKYRAQKKTWRKLFSHEELLYGGLIVSSLPFLASGIHVGHLLTLFPFVLLLLLHYFSDQTLTTKKRLSIVFLLIIVALLLISVRVFRHLNLRTIEYINDPIPAQIVTTLSVKSLEQKRLFINNGYVNVYYLLNNPSLNRFPMKFPLMTHPKLEEFDPYYEASLIRSLIENDVEVVVWVTRPYQQWGELKDLYTFVQRNYQFVDRVDSPVVQFELYQKAELDDWYR